MGGAGRGEGIARPKDEAEDPAADLEAATGGGGEDASRGNEGVPGKRIAELKTKDEVGREDAAAVKSQRAPDLEAAAGGGSGAVPGGEDEDVPSEVVPRPNSEAEAEAEAEAEDAAAARHTNLAPGAYYVRPSSPAANASAVEAAAPAEHDIVVPTAYLVEEGDVAAVEEAGGPRRRPTQGATSPVAIARVVPTIFGIDRKKFKGIVCVSSIAMIAVVLIAVLVGARGNNDGGDASGDSTEAKAGEEAGGRLGIFSPGSGSDHESDHQRAAALIPILTPIVEEGTFGVAGNVKPRQDKYGKDRRTVLKWLARDLDGYSIANDGESFVGFPTWKILQRYALGILYVSTTNSDGRGEGGGGGAGRGGEGIKDEAEDAVAMDSQRPPRFEEDIPTYVIKATWDWESKLDFMSSKDECDWYKSKPTDGDWGDDMTNVPETSITTKGVTCNDDGKVESILLWGNNLGGELPPELSVLSESLHTLNVNGNSITGEIPTSYGDLSKMTHLYFGGNRLQGEIPASLFGLDQLEMTSYDDNGLQGSLSGFCNAANYREGIHSIAADCGICPYNADGEPLQGYDGSTTTVEVECSCCICCDAMSGQCCNADGSYAFPSNDGLGAR